MSAINFTPIYIATTEASITNTNQFRNIALDEFIPKLRECKIGIKDGSHFLRTALKTNGGIVLNRNDENTENIASLIIIDCDQRFNRFTGEENDGAPPPNQIHEILKLNNINHILYGSYSNYEGNKGNRYRIVIPTSRPFQRDELTPTVESVVLLINSNIIGDELLVDAKENHTWSQGWYYQRQPSNTNITHLYFEFLTGNLFEVALADVPSSIPAKKTEKVVKLKNGQINPITAFNQQNKITDLLLKHGYRFVYKHGDVDKWINKDSKSGSPGVTIKDNKVFSYHGSDPLNDGYWHDAFDVMKLCESLSEGDAIKRAAQLTLAPDGRPLDEYNKSIFVKNNEKNTIQKELALPVIKAVSLSEFLKLELPPRENILHPWLPKAGLCMVFAKRGVGKTLFALEVTMAIAYGTSFLKFKAETPKKVCYIDGEMPANSMKERLAQIEIRMPFNENMIEPIFITPDLQEGAMPDLSTLEGQEILEPYTSQADLIIVDNISTLSRHGKESEAESWLPLQQWALKQRRLGKSVLFIHHAGKNGEQRGTSKREDILDTVIVLKQPADYEASMGCVFDLSFDKARHLSGEDVTALSCELTDQGWEYEPLEDNNYKKAVDLFNDGLKQFEIAEDLGISRGQVSKLIKKAKALGAING